MIDCIFRRTFATKKARYEKSVPLRGHFHTSDKKGVRALPREKGRRSARQPSNEIAKKQYIIKETASTMVVIKGLATTAGSR